MNRDEEVAAVIEAVEPAVVAIEKYVVELLRLSRFRDRRIESMAFDDVGYLRKVRREAFTAIFALKQFTPNGDRK